MRWVRYTAKGDAAGLPRLGIVRADGVIDLSRAYARYCGAGGVEDEKIAALLVTGSLAQWIRCAQASAFAAWLPAHTQTAELAWDTVRLHAPLNDPMRFIGIGLNYRAHAREIGQEDPVSPPLFAKWNSCISGPEDPIVRPRGCGALDYEGELGVIMGRTVRDVSAKEALDAVFGYTIINDVSARDWQFRTSQWLAGKVADGFAPMGPAVVGREEIPDPQALAVRTWVNGELRQDGSTSDMIFDVATLISILSTLTTLEAGDVIATGTPAGVGMSARPARYLKPGDHVRIEIAGIGAIANTVADAGDRSLRARHKGDYIEEE
ncbi:MAG: fumarylacetoacetate hydrolase family protein [Gammaproteobacteria bacterium]|nr:fumarylacetoacetate hydrolase family protein [Gammaproteobacteria bacterium]